MIYRKVLIIGFLITWSCVTYYFLLLNSPLLSSHAQTRLSQKIEKIETDLRSEYSHNKILLQSLVDALKLKYENDAVPMPEADTAQSAAEQAAVMEKAGDGIVAPAAQPAPAAAPNASHYLVDFNSVSYYSTGTGSDATGPVVPYVPRFANGQPIIPVLVFACNRVSISKCLDNLVQYRPSEQQFPIIVSQDCRDEATKNVILGYKDKVTLIEQPDQSDIIVPPKEKKFKGYYKIARHYGWALNTTFKLGYKYAIIVEDDLNVAPDFYEYFMGTHMLLKNDSSLWCVSAWNDNGKSNLIDTTQADLLYRTDFFPGLGWMLSKELWDELSVKWPKSFWDDWIRQPEQRKNRVCIRPEIPRTRTFGKIGVSNGLFFDKHLKFIKLSESFVPFTKMNLSYLLKDNYDRTFLKKIYTYPVVTYDELRRNLIKTDGPVRIQYTSLVQYKRITKLLGLMDDFKSGVPRTAYHGVVSFYYSNRRVHLAPNVNWKGYDLSWS